jgi:hypothetical protein
MPLRLKLLTLAGLCAVLVMMGGQPVRAGCTYGYVAFQYYVPTGTWVWDDSGCVFEGTAPDTQLHCRQWWVTGECIAGHVYYDCGCS